MTYVTAECRDCGCEVDCEPCPDCGGDVDEYCETCDATGIDGDLDDVECYRCHQRNRPELTDWERNR